MGAYSVLPPPPDTHIHPTHPTMGKHRMMKSEILKQNRKKYTHLNIVADWLSELRHCNENPKVPGSKPTRHSARLRDLTSL